MPTLKPGAKKVLGILVILGAFGVLKLGMSRGWVPTPGFLSSVVLKKAELPDVRESRIEGVEPAPFPSTVPTEVQGPQIRFLNWAWNAQIGLHYANGGPVTTEGSLMAKHGVNLKIIHQDDTNQMINELLACASELKEAKECSSGAHFIGIMADQSAAFFATNNPNFQKLCDDCTLEWIGSAGRSDGEDALMGPADWKENAQNAKGKTVATVIREGDWNIVIKWAADNGLKVNPDEKTYDPDAINFIGAANNPDVGEKFNANYCEERLVVKDGKRTGDKQKVCIDAVSVWTPVDVTVAKGRGGLVRIVSTHQYRAQMPHAIIGIKKWNKEHAKLVANMLAAMFEGGDQVRAFPEALTRAGEISAEIYTDDNPGEYWVKYYNGTKNEEDAQGNPVELGGSKVYGLADNLLLFGLASGANNNAKSTYTVFGNFVKQLYPSILPEYPKFEEVVTTSYITQAKALVGKAAAADVVAFKTTSKSNKVVSRKAVYIQFDTGQATIKPAGIRQLEDLKDDFAIAGGLIVKIYGYTDNTGTPEGNQVLSEARANAIRSYLMRTSPSEFPAGRFRVRGKGQDDPIADNTTEAGRARNRRVEIILADPGDE